MAIFRVTGNQGMLVVDTMTGNVLRYLPEEDSGYHDIVQLDVREWQHTYPNETITSGDHDILDFGFWTITGQYQEADTDWRADFRRDRELMR